MLLPYCQQQPVLVLLKTPCYKAPYRCLVAARYVHKPVLEPQNKIV